MRGDPYLKQMEGYNYATHLHKLIPKEKIPEIYWASMAEVCQEKGLLSETSTHGDLYDIVITEELKHLTLLKIEEYVRQAHRNRGVPIPDKG